MYEEPNSYLFSVALEVSCPCCCSKTDSRNTFIIIGHTDNQEVGHVVHNCKRIHKEDNDRQSKVFKLEQITLVIMRTIIHVIILTDNNN